MLTRTPTRTSTRTLRTTLLAGLAGAALALSACAADEVDSGSGGSGGTDEGAGSSGEAIVVGGADFTEMAIMKEMYAALLQDAGFETEVASADNRELYFGELAEGNIDVVPEYAATLAEFLNTQANGEGAAPIATSDAAATVEAARPLAEEQGVVLLEPAEAADQNGFAVAADFAEQNGLTTLTDLGALGQPVRLAATEECPTRPFCQIGLQDTYGITVSEVLPTGFGTPQTKSSVQNGESQLGLVATTDGTLEQFDLVLLEDDRGLQLADNLVPALNAELAEDTAVTDALDGLAEVLTTEDLTTLNAQVDAERQEAADVARAYLEQEGLIG